MKQKGYWIYIQDKGLTLYCRRCKCTRVPEIPIQVNAYFKIIDQFLIQHLACKETKFRRKAEK